MPQSDFDPILKSFDAKLSRSRRRKQCITYHPILKIPLQDKSTAPLIHMETVGPGKVDIKVGPEQVDIKFGPGKVVIKVGPEQVDIKFGPEKVVLKVVNTLQMNRCNSCS